MLAFFIPFDQFLEGFCELAHRFGEMEEVLLPDLVVWIVPLVSADRLLLPPIRVQLFTAVGVVYGHSSPKLFAEVAIFLAI